MPTATEPNTTPLEPATRSEGARLIHRCVEGLCRFDLAAVAAAFTPDAIWHMPHIGPIGGDLRGRGVIARHVIDTAQITGGTLRRELVEMIPGHEFATAVCRVRAAGPSGNLDVREFLLLRVSDGQVAEAWSFYEDSDAVRAFWRSLAGFTVEERRGA